MAAGGPVDHPGDRALLGSPHRELAKEDRAFIQGYIDDFYDIFIDRVAVTRKLPASEVRKIAEGRIWTGRDALEIGLVDELGGLAEAVETARSMANIPPSAELKIIHFPRPSSLGEIFESFSAVNVDQVLSTSFGAVRIDQVFEALAKGSNAAKPVTFEEQLMMFSRRLEPLCWMAVPDLFQSQPALTPLWRPNPLDTPRPPGLP